MVAGGRAARRSAGLARSPRIRQPGSRNSADYVVQILVPAETFQFLTPCCKIPNTVGVKLQDSPLISTVLFLTCAMTED
jgi:hypothetical protein